MIGSKPFKDFLPCTSKDTSKKYYVKEITVKEIGEGQLDACTVPRI